MEHAGSIKWLAVDGTIVAIGVGMTKIHVTLSLRRAITDYYQSRELVSIREVHDEYRMLARKGSHGIVGDSRLEALRAIFARHGHPVGLA